MSEEIELTLYSKEECHLCDEMEKAINLLPASMNVKLRKIDISKNPELEEKYGREIPILFSGDIQLARYKVSPDVLQKKLIKIVG